MKVAKYPSELEPSFLRSGKGSSDASINKVESVLKDLRSKYDDMVALRKKVGPDLTKTNASREKLLDPHVKELRNTIKKLGKELQTVEESIEADLKKNGPKSKHAKLARSLHSIEEELLSFDHAVRRAGQFD